MTKVLIGNIIRTSLFLLTLAYIGLTLLSAYMNMGTTNFDGEPNTVNANIFWAIQIILALTQLVAAFFLFIKDRIVILLLLLFAIAGIDLIFRFPVAPIYIGGLVILTGVFLLAGSPPRKHLKSKISASEA